MLGNPNIIGDLTKIKEKEEVLKFKDYIFMYIGSDIVNFKRKLDDAKFCLNDTICRTICICAVYNDNETSIECKRINNIFK